MQEQAKEKIKALVEKYEQIKSSCKIKSYTEEETKKDLIQPLLDALGWNVFDKNEVSAEENIVSSAIRRMAQNFLKRNKIILKRFSI